MTIVVFQPRRWREFICITTVWWYEKNTSFQMYEQQRVFEYDKSGFPIRTERMLAPREHSTHIWAHTPFKLLLCCSPALSLREGMLNWVKNKRSFSESPIRRLCSCWVSSLCLRTAAMCLETSNLIKLGQMREDLLTLLLSYASPEQ